MHKFTNLCTFVFSPVSKEEKSHKISEKNNKNSKFPKKMILHHFLPSKIHKVTHFTISHLKNAQIHTLFDKFAN